MATTPRVMIGRAPSRFAAAFVFAALAAGLGACDSPSEPSCSLTIAPASRAFPSGGGAGTVAVTASGSSCAWTATSNATWVTVEDGAGTGSGTASYLVAENATTDSRSTSLTIGDQTHAISQAGQPAVDCTYGINPASATAGHAGGPGTFAVAAPAGCAWAATSTASWLVVTGGATGTGNGTVAYQVGEHNGVDSRMATIAVADQTFSLTQEGESVLCSYSVSPVLFDPCMPAGTLTTTITAPVSCTWTATAGAPWLTVVSGDAGSGTGQVVFSFTSNYDAPREGVVMVRWPTPTLGQNVLVAQAGCLYAVTQSAFAFGAAGGTGSFGVLQTSDPITCGGALQDRCIWSAVADVPWITITTSMPRMGDDPVSFTVAPNATGTPRSGTITVRDKVVQVDQGG